MRAYFDLVEGAVITAAAVVLAVVDSTADVLVCKFSSHFYSSFQTLQMITAALISLCRRFIMLVTAQYILMEFFAFF